MAILTTGNFEMEVRFFKLSPDQEEVDYYFDFRAAGLPVINPALVSDKMSKNGSFTCYNQCHGDPDYLVPFFEKLLTEKVNCIWSDFPVDRIRLRAETNQSAKAEREKRYEGKTCMVQEEGVTKQVPYAEAISMFDEVFDQYFKLYVEIDSDYFKESPTGFENYEVCFKLNVPFSSLEVFLKQLRAEHVLIQALHVRNEEQ